MKKFSVFILVAILIGGWGANPTAARGPAGHPGNARPAGGHAPAAKPASRPAASHATQPRIQPSTVQKHFNKDPFQGGNLRPSDGKPVFRGGEPAARPETRPAARPETRPAARPNPSPNRMSPEAFDAKLNQFRKNHANVPGWNPKDGVAPNMTRPQWQGLDQDRIHHLQERQREAIAKKWKNPTPQQLDKRKDWANQVRKNWDQHHHPRPDGPDPHHPPHPGPHHPPHPGPPPFTPDWWHGHPYIGPWWGSHYAWNRYPWRYWWTVPVWASVCEWYAVWGWTQPYYYDYGPTGNIVYQDNRVYIQGNDVCSTEEFAQSAAELAAVETAEMDERGKEEWLPLGVFAVLGDPSEEDAQFAIQLAANKDGLISGTFFNRKTDQTYPVQGRIDPQTQRVAFIIQGADDDVFDTGFYNLMQQQTEVLVHLGKEKTKTCYFVRLETPEEG
ncbi:MAG: hypothetical protein Q4D62_05665 [Planctomycetia bacterium]|nr:hypothetical protein [Planctomycetia bacterium]